MERFDHNPSLQGADDSTLELLSQQSVHDDTHSACTSIATCIPPEKQAALWKSVVKISCESFSATGLVFDLTSDSIFLLASLHIFDCPETYDFLSQDFKEEIRKLKKELQSKNHTNTEPMGEAKTEQNEDDLSIGLTGKTKVEGNVKSELPKICIGQVVEGGTVEVLKFEIHPGICWKSSGVDDFAILKVSNQAGVDLRRFQRSGKKMFPTMNVYVLGFPQILQRCNFSHFHTINFSQITSESNNLMTLSELSSPGLSGGAIVCSQCGCVVGYLGGNLENSDGSPYQAYGYSVRCLPPFEG